MKRIIVHFGLHKTGTSTAEATLLDNRDALAPHMHIIGRKTWPDVSDAAKRLSEAPGQEREHAFRQAVDQHLAALPDDGRDICISNVDLSGRLPGHPDVHSYAAPPVLMGLFADALRRCFGTGAEIRFLVSTRMPDAWLRSLYWQNLKVNRITEDFDAFAARFADTARFAPMLDAVAAAIAPFPLTVTTLEDSKSTPLGPATPILSAMGVPADTISRFTPHRRLKVSPDPEWQEVLRDLNGSDLSDQELAEAKSDILALIRPDSPWQPEPSPSQPKATRQENKGL
ncbi:MAG: hypothetical protein P8X50_18090 [Maritimibacter sp.]